MTTIASIARPIFVPSASRVIRFEVVREAAAAVAIAMVVLAAIWL